MTFKCPLEIESLLRRQASNHHHHHHSNYYFRHDDVYKVRILHWNALGGPLQLQFPMWLDPFNFPEFSTKLVFLFVFYGMNINRFSTNDMSSFLFITSVI